MRIHVLALMFLAASAASALAQNAAPAPSLPALKTFASSIEVTALIAKAKTERKADQPLVLEPVLSLAPYRAQLEYRPGIAPAALHEKDAEMMYVIEGAGTIVTGGALANEKRTNAANLSGTSITGGNSQKLGPGDFIIIPENTPHQILPQEGGSIVLVSLHVPRPTSWP